MYSKEPQSSSKINHQNNNSQPNKKDYKKAWTRLNICVEAFSARSNVPSSCVSSFLFIASSPSSLLRHLCSEVQPDPDNCFDSLNVSPSVLAEDLDATELDRFLSHLVSDIFCFPSCIGRPDLNHDWNM